MCIFAALCASSAACTVQSGLAGFKKTKLETIFEEADQEHLCVAPVLSCGCVEVEALLQQTGLCAEVQVMLNAGSKLERQRIIRWLASSLVPLSLSPLTFKLAYRIVELATGHDRALLLEQLKLNAGPLSRSPHGHVVLAKVVETLPSASLSFMVDWLVGDGVVALAKHRYGCRILQKVVEQFAEDKLAAVFEEIVAAAPELSRHKFGNCVVQVVLEYAESHRDTLLQILMPTLAELAAHRCACHVARRCFECADEDLQESMLRSLIESGSLVGLVSDCHAYVLLEEVSQYDDAKPMLQEHLVLELKRLSGFRRGRSVLKLFGLEPCAEISADNCKFQPRVWT